MLYPETSPDRGRFECPVCGRLPHYDAVVRTPPGDDYIERVLAESARTCPNPPPPAEGFDSHARANGQ